MPFIAGYQCLGFKFSKKCNCFFKIPLPKIIISLRYLQGFVLIPELIPNWFLTIKSWALRDLNTDAGCFWSLGKLVICTDKFLLQASEIWSLYVTVGG